MKRPAGTSVLLSIGLILKEIYADTNLAQQRLKTRPEKLTTFHVAVILTVLGIIILSVGTKLASLSNSVYEQKQTYDDSESSICYISESNEGRQCQVTFNIDSDVTGPLYLYYQLDNFYQNHRRYYQSRSILQLQGQDLTESDVELDCSPLYMNNTLLLNPCGLIANSYFNDVITVDTSRSSPSSVTLEEDNIAIPSDRNANFKQVTGFLYGEVPGPTSTCADSGVKDMPDDCKSYYDSATNTYYKYYYPNEDTVQYLYESYPDQISPIDGVTDQHFIVWMRTEALPTFRKLYGKIPGSWVNGNTIVFNVTANYEVNSFKGKKSLVISNLGSFGGRNPFPGQVYITFGTFSLIFGVFLITREMGWLAFLKPYRERP